MAKCKFMRQDDGEKYCTMFLAKCDSKELEFCCDDNCTVRDMAEENETLNYQWHKQSEIGDEWYKIAEKYKVALQEIKEIAKENKDTAQYGGICKSILTLIEKAEVNNDR